MLMPALTRTPQLGEDHKQHQPSKKWLSFSLKGSLSLPGPGGEGGGEEPTMLPFSPNPCPAGVPDPW